MAEKQAKAPVGWTCPACGGGNAPWSAHCPCMVAAPRTLPATDGNTWNPLSGWRCAAGHWHRLGESCTMVQLPGA